jgi:hypothetical protein
MKYWPVIILGILGVLIAWMIAELTNLEPFKFRVIFIICLGLLGLLAGWALASKHTEG